MGEKYSRLAKDSSNEHLLEELSESEASSCEFDECGNEVSAAQTLESPKDVKIVECHLTSDSVAKFSIEKSQIIDESEMLNVITSEESNYYDIYKAATQVEHLKCTTCACQLFLDDPKNIEIHPALGVLLCKNCREFYDNGPFTKDENGQDEYCRWCAESGTLIISCNTCSNVFCKACLRRCLGRESFLEITSHACEWSCLICNNLPLWAQRALCRMAMSAINPIESTDPAIWLPDIIWEAKNLATYYKNLATKIETSWLKEGRNRNRARSRDKELDKRKAIRYCRKLRQGIVTTRLNMKLLEKKMVKKFASKYDNVTDIDVEHSEVFRASKKHVDKSRIENTRSVTEENSKQDCYAEIRRSNSSYSSAIISSPSPISGVRTLPRVLDTEESHNLSDLSTEAESLVDKSEETGFPVIDITDECNEFFSAVSAMMDKTPTKASSLQDGLVDRKPFPSLLAVKQRSNIYQNIYSSDSECSTTAVQNLDLIENGVNNENHNNSISKPKISSSPVRSEKSADFPGKSASAHARTQSKTTKGKPVVSKFLKIKPSSTEHLTSSLSSSEEESVVDSHLEAVASASHHSESIEFDGSSTLDLNETARQKLLLDSSDSDKECSFDSDFSLTETITSSVEKEKKTSPKPKEDDPKLKSPCVVVLNRINSKNSTVKISHLSEKPLNISTRSRRIESDELESELEFSELQKEGGKRKKCPMSKKEAIVKKRLWLEELESLSSSDSECDSSMELTDVTKSAPILSHHFNETTRQALLATSDSDSSGNSVGETEHSTEKNSSDEGGDVVETKASGVKKIQIVDLTTEEEEDAGVKTGNAKDDKLLRMDLDDPEAESKKIKKKSTKKKRRSRSDPDCKSQSSESEVEKRTRKKKRLNPSDREDSDDSDIDWNEIGTSSKSRHKKSTSNSDNSSDTDIDILNESQRSEGGGSKGRRNIKKIMKDASLKDETKAAAKEEEERKKRIAERQKFYNEVFVGDMDVVNVQTENLILDFDSKTKEELVVVNENIVSKLKLHQVKGVKFMWDACFESLEMLKQNHGSGCILAHCMGLGKSLQVVALAHTVLVHKACQVDRVLVICPVNTVLNWVNEFKVWLAASSEVDVYEMVTTRNNAKEQIRMHTLRKWLEGGGVLIIGYPMFRILTNENKIVKTQEDRDLVTQSLLNPGPQLVVCDEGHFLKNEKTALYLAINKIATRRRIVLTGTPLQNNLEEYFCMVQFVKPNLLGTIAEFKNRFANPIKNGQTADAETSDVKLMKRQAHVLHRLLENSVQRCDYGVLTPFLPPKHEYVISVKLSEIQIKLYQCYLKHHARKGRKGASLFADFQELGRVWTHPKALLWGELNRKTKQKNHNESKASVTADLTDDIGGAEPTISEEDLATCTEEFSDGKEPEASTSNRSTIGAAQEVKLTPEEESPVATTPVWWSQFSPEDMTEIEHGGKLVLLMDILNQCEFIGDKVLVFSQSLASLNLIEEFLALENERNEKNRDNLTSDNAATWRINQDYFRFDGSTPPEVRTSSCNAFNNSSNLRSRLFLISTKAGGIGINLVAANRVVIFDASWNPSHDVQSIFRVYRFGQTKPCYVYRFLAQGTMEEKIYDRQVTKLSLACRVVDEQQIERHFNSSDLHELYLFEPDSHLRRPTPLVPKDRLLAELIIKHKNWIVTYHEHDSLLVNKSEEELPEAERMAAWEDFQSGLLQKEKRRANSLTMNESLGFENIPGMQEIAEGLVGLTVNGISLTAIAATIHNSNPDIPEAELLGRLQMTVDQLRNSSAQQAADVVPMASLSSSQQPGPQYPTYRSDSASTVSGFPNAK